MAPPRHTGYCKLGKERRPMQSEFIRITSRIPLKRQAEVMEEGLRRLAN